MARFAAGVRRFLRSQAVPTISVTAALVTCLFVPPDAAYAGYVDLETLGRLACVLAVVGALRSTGLFEMLAARLVRRCRSTRALVCALVGVTALASMFVTNDMALVALLPLSAASMVEARRRDLVAPVFVLQGVAANLCGMLLPFGNPQNIYLSARFDIGLGPFLATMAPPFLLSVALVALGCLVLVPRGRVEVDVAVHAVPGRRVALLAALLALCVAAVLGVVPVWVAFPAVFGCLAAVDRPSLARTDWGLIVTFAAFFVFSGNIARIEAVREAFTAWVSWGAFVPAAVLSQVISNVPAAVVLAQFTGDWAGLLAGVNVGGAGTPVASLATLIVMTHYGALARSLPARGTGAPQAALRSGGRFAALLCAVNGACLAVLLAAGVLAGW